jgi:hypothetical protein
MKYFRLLLISIAVTYFTSKASATIPAARGAEAEVPVCLMVQVFLRSVVACKVNRNNTMMDLEQLGPSIRKSWH